MKVNISIFIFILSLALFSCDEKEIGTPKPRTYPRVDFPQKEYLIFNSTNCNYKYEYPTYAIINQEKKFFGKKAPNNCWHTIIFPKFNGKLHLTYYPIKNRKDFDKLIDDSFELTSIHDIKASGRQEIIIQTKNNISGILFKIEGVVASQTQFFLTDSTENFIRGSLYFNNKVNPDSMRIIQNFIDKDVEHLINSFTWK